MCTSQNVNSVSCADLKITMYVSVCMCCGNHVIIVHENKVQCTLDQVDAYKIHMNKCQVYYVHLTTDFYTVTVQLCRYTLVRVQSSELSSLYTNAK